MEKEKLELELLDLETLYKNTRNKITKAELADKIAAKKREIANLDTPVLEKNVIPQANAPARMDHTNSVRKSGFMSNGDTFNVIL